MSWLGINYVPQLVTHVNSLTWKTLIKSANAISVSRSCWPSIWDRKWKANAASQSAHCPSRTPFRVRAIVKIKRKWKICFLKARMHSNLVVYHRRQSLFGVFNWRIALALTVGIAGSGFPSSCAGLRLLSHVQGTHQITCERVSQLYLVDNGLIVLRWHSEQSRVTASAGEAAPLSKSSCWQERRGDTSPERGAK